MLGLDPAIFFVGVSLEDLLKLDESVATEPEVVEFLTFFVLVAVEPEARESFMFLAFAAAFPLLVLLIPSCLRIRADLVLLAISSHKLITGKKVYLYKGTERHSRMNS